MSDEKVRTIFRAMCYDTDEEDPWVYMSCLSQDFLPDGLKPLRVVCANHILKHFLEGAWAHQVAIDPCSTLLPKTLERLQQMEVVAMSKNKWMSKGSARLGNNLRAAATATKQGGNDVHQVHWTPVFAKGRLRIYVCDAEQAERNPLLPDKLNDGENLAKCVRTVLPRILEEMRDAYGWRTLPNVLVHDKASYMVSTLHDHVNANFLAALKGVGLRSWLGNGSGITKWLVKQWGDVYLHETVIAHIRRLLANKFASNRLVETVGHFRARMDRVAAHMNSAEFNATGGGGLLSLARELPERCQAVIDGGGERLKS